MTQRSTKQIIQSDEELETENSSSIKQHSKPSEKVQQKDKETLKKTQKQLVALQKKLKKLEKGQQKGITPLNNHLDDSEDGPESEEEDSIMFSSSIKPIEVIPTPESETQPLRQVYSHDQQARQPTPLCSPSQRLATSSSTNDITKMDCKHRMERQSPLVEKRPLSPSATSSPPSKSLKKPLLLVVLANGVKLSSAPKTADFRDAQVRTLILRAVREYEALICTKNSFPSLSVHAQWAESCWAIAQIVPNDELDEGQRYKFTPRILGVIQRRGSTMCSRLLEPTRTQVIVCFGFRQGGKERGMKWNETSARNLYLNKTFHYKTLIDHCISEWHSGLFVQADFKEDNVGDFYKVSLANLKKWTSLNATVTTNKRKKLFDHAFKKLGGLTSGEPQVQLKGDTEERTQKELEGHTGETDSEGDEHDGEAGDD
ncbi:hypothetical protein H0H81_003268 [Sphagnurus paluster]|uniref:DUF6532 domain-containing protein n=1 Tax=Sphagnurus paluster TaxID=117069 RepID=A0A9P7GJ94_9AGAR|nr:hypothetical protein H0H81_003268 [Sphagnurus paluster]